MWPPLIRVLNTGPPPLFLLDHCQYYLPIYAKIFQLTSFIQKFCDQNFLHILLGLCSSLCVVGKQQIHSKFYWGMPSEKTDEFCDVTCELVIRKFVSWRHVLVVMTLFEIYTYAKAFRRNLVPPSSGCKLVMPTRTLSFPFNATSTSDCHRTTAPLSSVAAGFGVNRLDVKRRRCGGGRHSPNIAALSRIVTAGRHLMALQSIVRVAHSRWQQRAACSSLQSVQFHTDRKEARWPEASVRATLTFRHRAPPM